MITAHGFEYACRRYGVITATMAAIVVIVRGLLEMEI